METPTGVVLGRKGVGQAGLKKSAVQGQWDCDQSKKEGAYKSEKLTLW
jgi:hypothetical protein